MRSCIYLDESGDLGFNFSKPFRFGGSSRYLTIALILCPVHKSHLLKRIVKKVYRKFDLDITREIKATDLNAFQRAFVCSELKKIILKHPSVKAGSITVKKTHILPHIQQEPNLIYNYLMKLAVLPLISSHESCLLNRDSRSVKTASGNSCRDYLQSTLWFDLSSSTSLKDNPLQSHLSKGIMLTDWLTNIVWKHYEDKQSEHFGSLRELLNNQELLFSSGKFELALN